MTDYNFTELTPGANYDIIDGESCHWITQGIQGADALSQDWPEDAEAWPAGESDFSGSPVEVAS